MTHRGHEDFTPISPPRKFRSKRDFEAIRGSNGYFAEQNRIRRRSLSPSHDAKVARSIFLGEQKSDFNWHLDEGRSHKNPSFVLPDSQRCENTYHNEGTVTMKCVGVREPHGTSKSKRNTIGDGHEILFVDHRGDDWKEPLYGENEMSKRSYRTSLPLIPASHYERDKDYIPFPSQRTGVSQHELEKVHYVEPTAPGKMSNRNMYAEVKRPLFQSNQKPLKTMGSSFPKKFGSDYEFEDFIGTSQGHAKSEVLGFYGNDVSLHAPDNYPKRNAKPIEIMDHNACGQRAVLNAFDSDADEMTIADSMHTACHTKSGEGRNLHYPKFQRKANDGLHSMIPAYSLSEHNQAQMDREHQKNSKRSIVPHAFETFDCAEGSHGRSSIFHNHLVGAERGAIGNFDTHRMQLHSNNDDDDDDDRVYCPENDHAVINRSDYQSYLVGMPHGGQISNLRTHYGIDSGRSARILTKKMLDSPVSRYETEMQGFDVRRPEKELSAYDMCDATFGRTYMEEGCSSRHDKTTESNRWFGSENLGCHYDGEKWIDEDQDDLHEAWARKGDGARDYESAERSFDLGSHFENYLSDSPFSTQGFMLMDRTRQNWHHKAFSKYANGSSSYGSLRLHKSQKFCKKSNVHGKKSSWKVSDHHGGEGRANAHGLLDERADPLVPDPMEHTEEFMKLVNSAFFKYSKILNLNSTNQRKYREPGKYSCFVCIVCHSSSKVFGDIQRLARHAFMCHNDALRAKHRGLLRAICVLMGWNSFIPPGSSTWVPRPLSAAEAFAQKDDLLIWPPVVIIRNISMTKNNPEEQVVVPIEAVQALLRGKGFVGGKVNVGLGKPADQSVILVKFLATFPGLRMANSLHGYFAENKHGREEFERDTPSGSKAVAPLPTLPEAGERADVAEEHHLLLYGYVGIAEDLDRLDFYTKGRISIMSKKEIQDLADAPVKAAG